MTFSKLLASLALPVMIAGCASFPGTTYELEELERTKPSGSPFTQALAKEYRAFAGSERMQYSWFYSQHFARKGLAAAHGTVVPPEDMSDWSISDKDAWTALTAARGRLMAALGANAAGRVPVLSATAQVKFDCWIEQQHKDWRPEEIVACRRDFMAAMEAIESQAKMAAIMESVSHPPAATPAGTPPPAAGAAPAAAPAPSVAAGQATNYQLFFNFNRDALTPEAGRSVTNVAAAAKAAGYPKMEIIGYTDLTGTTAYNMKLSLRRAAAVRKALVAAGVPADRLRIEGRGKAEPLVSTADGVREPQNRRVVVRFSR
ncbi:OmpA family protein [Telmatospirillum sp.]|uniref:OmpA family protein n=1 Tax=Telmatospirillum sp. TaxID=2079197 RepID=UPI00283E1DC6|nr:OmpA family protein [Telmatospirillum sp.]MDR3437623.1 OmpA family protein [Telmatospirillum sp.]